MACARVRKPGCSQTQTEGYCLQILATNRDPEVHNGKVLQMASHLTWILAEYLADTLAWLMRSILEHDTKILCDKDRQLLLTAKFWILPLYRELLNSARRNRPSPSSERARGAMPRRLQHLCGWVIGQG